MEINKLHRTASRKASRKPAAKPRAVTHAHEESQLQRNCVAWFRLQYPKHAPMLFAVPNGGGRSRIEAAIMKAEGVTAGVADLLLLEARGGWGSLCIEMKTDSKASRQRDSQKEWQLAAEQYGNRYEICRTFEQFMAIVKDYMDLPMSCGRVIVHHAEVDIDDRALRLIAFEPEKKGPDL